MHSKILTFISLIILVLIFAVMKNLGDECDSKIVKDCLVVIMMLSLIAFVIGISYGLCKTRGSCSTTGGFGILGLIVFVMSSIIITTTSLILSELDKREDKCNEKKIKNNIIIILALGCVMFLVSGYKLVKK